jgi:catechol 2,3-dioxygenase-like lactoylglutathione lyase family enzyme
MSGINGVDTVIYGVEDLALCTRYFVDFGLPLVEQTDKESVFELEEGSSVIIRPLAEAVTPGQRLVGYGVQKVIWGAPSAKAFDRIVAKLRRVTDVEIDADGVAHFLDCDGIAMGVRVFDKKKIWGAPDPVNSYANVGRINQHRKWRLKANPKTIQHVVFTTPNPEASWNWYRDNLDFRLSDIQEGFGVFARAPGTNDHHTFYWLDAHLPFPGLDGQTRFNHVNYGVEDLDELMVGTNYMERKGWAKSVWGLGRHRIASSLFMYLPCPAGGDAEYGTDSDVLDDSWVPRRWNAGFGTMSFMHNLPKFLLDDSPWDVGYVPGVTPAGKPHEPPARPADPHEAEGAVAVHPHTERPPEAVTADGRKA